MIEGRCLCGAVRFCGDAEPRAPVACHCEECRRQSGHHWSAAAVPEAALRIEGEVRRHAASEKARRGFCPRCGSFLFWDPVGEDVVAVAMGALDGPTGLSLREHLWVSEKGDCHDLADGLPQRPRD